MAERKKVAKQRHRAKKNVPQGHAHVQASFNNTIITITDLTGAVVSWGSAGVAGQGLAQETPYAAALPPSRRPRDGARTRHEVFVKWARRARAGHPLAAGSRAGGQRHHRRHAHPAQRLPPAQAAPGLI
jgi:hypothetical protein